MHEYCIHGAPQVLKTFILNRLSFNVLRYIEIWISQDALVVCRLRKNADFRASSTQKMEDGVVQDDGYVGQSGGSEKKDKSYYESEHQIPNGDIAESSNVVEVSLLLRNVSFNDV